MAKPPIETTALLAQLRMTYPDIAVLNSIREGEESRAFVFISAGSDYVVRVNPSRTGFDNEKFAFEHFNSPALPIPEVTLVAPHGPKLWLCVSRRAPGTTLQELPAGGAFAYGAAVSSVLDAMAHVTPNDGTGLASQKAWPTFLTDVAGRDWSLLDRTARDFVVGAASFIADMAKDLGDPRRLIHGDFGSNNLVVAQGEVTGVIDWSETMIGDPDYDVANNLFWRPWLDCMEQQCRYFEQHEPWRLTDTSKLACYQLRIGLGVLHDAIRDDDERMINWSLARCRTIAETT